MHAEVEPTGLVSSFHPEDDDLARSAERRGIRAGKSNLCLHRWSFWRTLLAGVGSRGVGRAGGRRSGLGSVGSRGWFTLGAAPLGVGAGGWVIGQPGQDDHNVGPG
jgi:hypothetical protein